MATVSELISERQRTIAKSWQNFLQSPLHQSIAVVVEREKTNLPANFVPWAPGIVIASDRLLRAAGRARNWKLWGQHPTNGYYYIAQAIVRERSGFWFLEEQGSKVLVYLFGSMPICTRTRREAINLYEYMIRDRGRAWLHGLCWVRSKPDGILGF